MRNYYIYLIEDDVARSFFGKEFKLFDLFDEARYSRDIKAKEQLNRQIQYITKIIPMFYFGKKLFDEGRIIPGYQLKGDLHSIYEEKKDSYAELKIYEQYIEMKAKGSFSAEMYFFEALKDINPYFLAIDYENERFGWLKPLKSASLI